MRFFIVFLVFALSLAVNAANPSPIVGEELFADLEEDIEGLSKALDTKILCAFNSDQSCEISELYMTTRDKLLSDIKLFVQQAEKVFRDIFAGKILRLIVDDIGYFRKHSTILNALAKTLISNLPQATPPKIKEGIENYISKIDRDLQKLEEHFEREISSQQQTSEFKQLNTN